MDDNSLVNSIKKGDKTAFKKLFLKYHKPLVAYTISFTNDEALADDIVQKSFISLWERREKLEIQSSIKSYLYSTCYKMFISDYRTKKRRDRLLDNYKEEALREKIELDPEEINLKVEKMRLLINQLPPKCKEILELNKFQGLQYKEIAEALNISVKTVEAQMSNAYKKIREGFKDDQVILFILNYIKISKSNS